MRGSIITDKQVWWKCVLFIRYEQEVFDVRVRVPLSLNADCSCSLSCYLRNIYASLQVWIELATIQQFVQ